MGVYFNWILFWKSLNGEKPEGVDPEGYFELDNVSDSTEIKVDEKKFEVSLPLLQGMRNKAFKLSFDEKDHARLYWKETRRIVAVLERTERNDMQSEEMVQMKIGEIMQVFPEKGYTPMGIKGEVDWRRAGDWFAEMKNHYTQQRLIGRFLKRVRLFQQYSYGQVHAYIQWFFGTDGPVQMLAKAEEVVFGNWMQMIDEIEKLSREVLPEDSIDEDHFPFHLEDCQIAVHLIDLMNWYPGYVHGVKRPPQLQERVQVFKQLYADLSLRPICY